MVRTLRVNFQASLSDYTESENAAQASWEKIDAELANEIETLESEIEILETHIVEMRECVAQETKIFDDASEKVTRNT
jgi:hypothetical protein